MKLTHLLLVALVPTMVAADPEPRALPLPLPQRPFLLVDAPRRYLPTEAAVVRVQRRGHGPVDLAVFRVRTIASLVTAPWSSQGVSIASRPLGLETEALLARSDALPRRGGNADLIALRRLSLRTSRPVRRAVGNETAAYDSNETSEGTVETWGVGAGDWSQEDFSLGPLPTGVYLVRAIAGGWSASAVLSVGELTLLARRGDVRDWVFVTDGEGIPQRGVTVQRFVEGAPGERAVTDATGQADFPASDAPSVRYVAVRNDDVAWADVTHARLPSCDVRAYLATGRPVYRPGERVQLRGHVRGCVDGRDVPLADEPVEVDNRSHASVVRTRTDRDGNFVAELPASSELVARVRGREHSRTLHLDSRRLPTRALRLRLDRPWAAAGETVTATLSDDDDGWPHDAMAFVHTPTGPTAVPIGPGRPARVTFTMPPTDEPLRRVVLRAEVPDGAGSALATTELWTGAARDVIELTSEATQGRTGENFSLRVMARDLGGNERPGSAVLRVFGSDGNGPVGAARSERAVTLPFAGTVRLDGAGPWWIEAGAAGDTHARNASLVVWERARPPSLSPRGPLAVTVPAGPLRPGTPLALSLRAPAVGATLITLEQGGVWAARTVTPAQTGTVSLPVPEEARGMATVVATHIHGGQVTSSTAAVEVETARRFALTVRTDRRSYHAPSQARVVVQARNADGSPRDAVVSLWVADAGWWELGEENHPSPDAWFRLPGRPASAGDSTHPLGYGAEEGRRFLPVLEWNGQALPGSTFRHTWLSTAPLVSFDATGTFATVANTLARAAGLARAEVCAEADRRAGTLRVRARHIPWDLAAARFAERVETGADLVNNVLRFDCGAGGVGLGTIGMGSTQGLGSGSGRGGSGTETGETLDGTLFFLGLRRLGPTGETVVEVPLPPRAGRWRAEALAIADDGAGTSAHAEFVTTRPLVARLALPASLVVGDTAQGTLSVEAPALAGREVAVTLEAVEGLRLRSSGSHTLVLDARGFGETSFVAEAVRVGRWSLDGSVRAPGFDPERVTLPVSVRSDPSREPVDFDTAIGPEETEVELRVPPLDAPASLEFSRGTGSEAGFRAVIDALREPSWNVPPMLLARLRVWRELYEALGGPASRQGHLAHGELHDTVRHGFLGAAAAVRERLGIDGGIAWWQGLRADPVLTAIVVELLHDVLSDAERRGARQGLLAALRTASHPLVRAHIAAALARDDDRSAREAAREALDPLLARTERDALGDHALVVWERVVTAARRLGDTARAHSAATRLASALDQRIAQTGDTPCRGPAWFLCLRGDSDRARVARAARTLVLDDPGQRPRAARALAWIARHPVRREGPWWGQDEAAVLALQATFSPHAVGEAVSVRLDGREIGRLPVAATTRIEVPRGGVLTVLFPRQEGRVERLRIQGALSVLPVERAVGNVPLARRVETQDGVPFLVLEFTLPTAARDIELHAPLPARWQMAGRAGSNGAQSTGGTRPDRWGFDLSHWDWYALDRTPANQPPRVAFVDGALRVRYTALRAGRHVLRVPLVPVAEGTFHAGGAWLQGEGGRLWARTPPWAP